MVNGRMGIRSDPSKDAPPLPPDVSRSTWKSRLQSKHSRSGSKWPNREPIFFGFGPRRRNVWNRKPSPTFFGFVFIGPVGSPEVPVGQLRPETLKFCLPEKNLSSEISNIFICSKAWKITSAPRGCSSVGSTSFKRSRVTVQLYWRGFQSYWSLSIRWQEKIFAAPSVAKDLRTLYGEMLWKNFSTMPTYSFNVSGSNATGIFYLKPLYLSLLTFE